MAVVRGSGICKRGHEVSGDNLYVAPKDGKKTCKKCRVIRLANYVAKLKDADRTAFHKKRTDRRMFGGNREKAIQRDGEKCLHCGMTRQEHKTKYGVDITVDHIDGNGVMLPTFEKNNDINNLQTLCLPCHGRKDHKRRSLTT